mgnify:CR=1 FL=1
MAKDKILISGGTGYVGTPLLKLLKKNYDIKLISRQKDIHKDIEYIKTKNLFNENKKWWIKNLKDTKYFIFLSWDVSHSKYTSDFQNLKWMTQIIKIAKIARYNSKISSFICIGCCKSFIFIFCTNLLMWASLIGRLLGSKLNNS